MPKFELTILKFTYAEALIHMMLSIGIYVKMVYNFTLSMMALKLSYSTHFKIC